MQIKTTVKPSYDRETGDIRLEFESRTGELIGQHWAEVTNTTDAVTRAMLMGMGWTPPPKKNDVSAGALLRLADGQMHPATAENRSKAAAEIQLRAAELIHDAANAGFIVTIEREPLRPLAMGHHLAVIDVYPARLLQDDTLRNSAVLAWDEERRKRGVA